MRLMTNEELLLVAGGELTYKAFGQEDMAMAMEQMGFSSWAFDDGFGSGSKERTEKPSKSELTQMMNEMRKLLPGAEVSCTATANNKGPGGSTQWEVTCTFKAKTRG